MASVYSRKGGKRMMAEMNVVPYIDVTLVLLIIFMITAPLITQGVKVDLPQAPSQVVEPSNKEPVIVSVNEAGEVFIDFGDNPDKAVDEETLVTRIAAVNKYQPGTQFLVKGDRGASYGRVVQVMALMQSAGIETVGLLTEPPDKAR